MSGIKFSIRKISSTQSKDSKLKTFSFGEKKKKRSLFVSQWSQAAHVSTCIWCTRQWWLNLGNSKKKKRANAEHCRQTHVWYNKNHLTTLSFKRDRQTKYWLLLLLHKVYMSQIKSEDVDNIASFYCMCMLNMKNRNVSSLAFVHAG